MSIKHSNQRPGKGGSLLKKYLSTNIIVCSNPFFQCFIYYNAYKCQIRGECYSFCFHALALSTVMLFTMSFLPQEIFSNRNGDMERSSKQRADHNSEVVCVWDGSCRAGQFGVTVGSPDGH